MHPSALKVIIEQGEWRAMFGYMFAGHMGPLHARRSTLAKFCDCSTTELHSNITKQGIGPWCICDILQKLKICSRIWLWRVLFLSVHRLVRIKIAVDSATRVSSYHFESWIWFTFTCVIAQYRIIIKIGFTPFCTVTIPDVYKRQP